MRRTAHYQVLLSAYRGIHGLSVVLAAEGTYYYEATWAAVCAFRRDLNRHYEQELKFTVVSRNRSLNACRQPIPDNVARNATVYPYLHFLLCQLQKEYRRIITAKDVVRPESPKNLLNHLKQYNTLVQTKLYLNTLVVLCPDLQ